MMLTQVAKKIIELTTDRIFVAHNVHFDFSFVHKEFADLGFSFKAEKLCTVRLARTHFPGLASYSLGKLCKDIGIKLENAHRALDDAHASAEILVKILNNETEVVAEKLAFPPHLNPSDYEALPMEVGVYEFFDQEGYLLYVGKSRYIKSRVASHFRVGFDRKHELQFKNQISTVKATRTYSELLALLLEDTWIKEKRPRYNISSRRIFEEYGLYEDQDAIGEWCLRVKKIHNDLTPLIAVKSRRSGDYYIKKLMGEALAMSTGGTIREKVLSLIKSQHYPYQDFNIVDGSVIVKVREGRLVEAEIYSPEDGELVNTYKLREGLDSRRIIMDHSLKKRLKMIPVSPEFL
jgi:DNA polymerase III epsilon subunit-like protein